MRFNGSVMTYKTTISIGFCVILSACSSQPKQVSYVQSVPVKQVDASKTVEEREVNMTNAVETPAEDLHLKHWVTPPILLKAEEDPYAVSDDINCTDIIDEIQRLNVELGPDIDSAAPPKGSLTDQGTKQAHDTAVDLTKQSIGHFIPFRGVVRWASGAEKEYKERQKAIAAGRQRRAFLKGIALSKKCVLPAPPIVSPPKPDLKKK